MRTVVGLLMALSLKAQTVRIQNPATMHKPNGYSHVAEVSGGKMVFIAGQWRSIRLALQLVRMTSRPS